MKRVVPLLVVLLAFTLYVYVTHILPSRRADKEVRGSGSIEATTVTISPKVAARILAIAVSEGDKVVAGQLLVTLQCDDLAARQAQADAQTAQAEGAVAQAQAAALQATAQTAPLAVQAAQARRENERMQTLAKSGAVTTRALEQAEAAQSASAEQQRAAELAAAATRRTVDVASLQVTVAKRSAEFVASQRSECELRSPLAATVLGRNYEPGEMALPGSALLKLGNLAAVHTWIYVANEEMGRVRIGQKVMLRADTYPERQFEATVTRINAQAEFTPRSIQTKEDRTRLVFGVKVEVQNTDGALLPGMPVEAVLQPVADVTSSR